MYVEIILYLRVIIQYRSNVDDPGKGNRMLCDSINCIISSYSIKLIFITTNQPTKLYSIELHVILFSCSLHSAVASIILSTYLIWDMFWVYSFPELKSLYILNWNRKSYNALKIINFIKTRKQPANGVPQNTISNISTWCRFYTLTTLYIHTYFYPKFFKYYNFSFTLHFLAQKRLLKSSSL